MNASAAIIIAAFHITVASAQHGSSWDPVTQGDWDIGKDSSGDRSDAVMIFEKVFADDTDLDDEECRLRIYRRIRILSAEGRREADIRITFVPQHSKILRISGRTILPGGQVIELRPENIVQKNVLRTEDFKMLEQSFSLAGVTDDCVIEYAYEMENTFFNRSWVVQKEIPLLQGVYKWKFFRSTFDAYRLESLLISLFSFDLWPNYHLVNGQRKLNIETIPTPDKPEEAIFRIDSLPAFEPEPYALPDEALKTNLRLYYGSLGYAGNYWTIISHRVQAGVDKFLSSDKVLKKLAESFSSLPTSEAKVDSAYRWLQDRIQNVTFSTEGKFKQNEDAEDVLDRRYGTLEEINYLFYGILKSFGLNAHIFYAVNRSEGLFYDLAKYWQFEHSIVGIRDSTGKFTFYSPGHVLCRSGQLPWYYEGSSALIIGVNVGQSLVSELPTSKPSQNLLRRELVAHLNPEGDLEVSCQEEYTGHEARRLQLMLRNTAGVDSVQILKTEISRGLSDEWEKSVSISKFEQHEDSLLIDYRMKGPALEEDVSGKILFQPFLIFSERDSTFVADKRRFPIMFEYPMQISETIRLSIDSSVTVEVLPSPITVRNPVGTLEIRIGQEAGQVVLRSDFERKGPFFSPDFYSSARTLFDQKARSKELTIVLRRSR